MEGYNLNDNAEVGIKVAIIGHGGAGDKAIHALEEIKSTYNQEIIIFSCNDIEEAKNLGVTAIIDGNELLKPDDVFLREKKFLELKNTICDLELNFLEEEDEKENWTQPQGTKQKKFRKGNNRKRKRRK